jgi:hypothetical protein
MNFNNLKNIIKSCENFHNKFPNEVDLLISSDFEDFIENKKIIIDELKIEYHLFLVLIVLIGFREYFLELILNYFLILNHH